jgi:L-ascorbate metabolism protein UlaG (beta-lactamase superfamily)
MRLTFLILLTTALYACGERPAGEELSDSAATARGEETTRLDDNRFGEVTVHPVYHGSVVVEFRDGFIYVDPHGGAERYEDFGDPELVLITHTHGDHMDKETLGGLDLSEASLVAPPVVIQAMEEVEFPQKITLKNGVGSKIKGIGVEAVPAYNLPKADDAFHPPGKFNGYVLTLGEQRLYFSGDTEDIEEMRALRDIDVAFVCMNQPYTMTVEQAADAVADFKPAVVYPYHYRNQGGTKSDVEKFEAILSESAPTVDVHLRDWYPEVGSK